MGLLPESNWRPVGTGNHGPRGGLARAKHLYVRAEWGRNPYDCSVILEPPRRSRFGCQASSIIGSVLVARVGMIAVSNPTEE